MKIFELIRILQLAPDKDAQVYIQNGDLLTNVINFSFDDNNDVQLYEVAKQEILF
jgi:hypothetical protein